MRKLSISHCSPALRAGAMAAGTTPEPGTVSPPKIRDVTGWLMRHPDALDTHGQQRLACLRTQCPHLDHLADHVTSFAKMITERTGAQELEAWLTGDTGPVGREDRDPAGAPRRRRPGPGRGARAPGPSASRHRDDHSPPRH